MEEIDDLSDSFTYSTLQRRKQREDELAVLRDMIDQICRYRAVLPVRSEDNDPDHELN